MPLSTPDWLARRGGDVRLGSDGQTWYVFITGQPLYSLVGVPVNAQCGCVVRQTNNGKILAQAVASPTADAALRAGLEALAAQLGW